MKDNMINSIGIFLIIALVYLGGVGTSKITQDMRAIDPISVEDTIDVFDKKQVVRTKEDTDFTGTTQGDTSRCDSILEQIEPDFIYYDTIEMKREADSVDAYMKHWYEVLDTNSNGEIDDMEIMDCGGEVHDTIIEE